MITENITKHELIKQYRDNPAISQSFLKKVLINNTQETKINSVAKLLGGLVDTILTANECLEDLYLVSNIQSYPKPQVKEVWDTYYKTLVDNNLPIEIDNTHLIEIYKSISSIKSNEEKMLSNLMEGEEYWNNLSSGKIVVSQEYWNKCNLVASSLKYNSITKDYFQEDLFKEIRFQEPLFWTYTDVEGNWQQECKGLLDILIINHHNKTMQIIDIKTTGDSLNSWVKNIARKYRYDFQLSFYNYGLGILYPEYIILNPIIIVENVDYPGKPRVFDFTSTDLIHGRHGCVKRKATIITEEVDVAYEEEVIHGWETAIERYIQAKQLGLPDYDIAYARNHGRENLNLWT